MLHNTVWLHQELKPLDRPMTFVLWSSLESAFLKLTWLGFSYHHQNMTLNHFACLCVRVCVCVCVCGRHGGGVVKVKWIRSGGLSALTFTQLLVSGFALGRGMRQWWAWSSSCPVNHLTTGFFRIRLKKTFFHRLPSVAALLAQIFVFCYRTPLCTRLP